MEGGLICRNNQAPQVVGACCFLTKGQRQRGPPPTWPLAVSPRGPLRLPRKPPSGGCCIHRLIDRAGLPLTRPIIPCPPGQLIARSEPPLRPGRAGQGSRVETQGVRAGRVCAICNRGGCRIGEPGQREQSSKHIFLGAPVLCNDLRPNPWHLSPDMMMSGFRGWLVGRYIVRKRDP